MQRRRFSENASVSPKNPLEGNEAPDSRSPSPPLPSRLDRIPSPSSYEKDASHSKWNSNEDNQDNESVHKKEDAEPKALTIGEKLRKISEATHKRSRSRSRERSRRRSNSRSPVRRRRSRSRSPRRSRSPYRRRSRSRERRRRSRSGSRDRRRRSRSRSRDRRNRRRSPRRSRSPRRRSRSPRRRRSRSPRRRYSRSPRRYSRSPIRRKPGIAEDKRVVTTEDVEARLARHMKTVQEKAQEEAKKINLPGYLNPAMVNVQQFKQLRDKRKLLWSKAKEKKGGAQWSGAFDDENSDEKFRRLMGINEENLGDAADGEKVQQSRRVLDELEKEYENSRAFQLSRGAGGVTGIGLGFGSLQPPMQ